jgi:hypothetical protein
VEAEVAIGDQQGGGSRGGEGNVRGKPENAGEEEAEESRHLALQKLHEGRQAGDDTHDPVSCVCCCWDCEEVSPT